MAKPGLGNQKEGADHNERGKTPSASQRQEGNHEGDCEKRKAQKGYGTKWRLEKIKTEIFGINDTANVTSC